MNLLNTGLAAGALVTGEDGAATVTLAAAV